MRTVEYARRAGTPLSLDLRTSSRAGAPVVIYLHGGAWVVGSRADHGERLDGLADAGITVASIDYRLVTQAPYPAQREDVEAAADWLIREGYAASHARIVLMGASAGAHLAALTCFTSHAAFAGFVGLFGRYDLTSAADDLRPAPGLPIPAEILANTLPLGFETPRARAAALAGVPPDDLTDDLLRQLSPSARLSRSSPPLLLLHGGADALVHHEHSMALARAAELHGVEFEVVLAPDANHEDPAFDEPRYLDQIARFAQHVTASSAQK